MDRESEPSLPYLKDISAMNMERYIEAVHQYTLSSREHAVLAPWIRDRIPMVMLEHELPRTKEHLLGLAAKHHIMLVRTAPAVRLSDETVPSLRIWCFRVLGCETQ